MGELEIAARVRLLGWTGLIFLIVAVPAWGEYQGTDLFGNLFGDANSGSDVPLPYYALDWNVDNGFTGVDNAGAETAHFLANQCWSGAMYLANFVSGLLTFAIGLDLVTGPHGVLEPISRATSRLYDFVGTEWLVVFLLGSAVWAVKTMVWDRQVATGALMLALSVLFCGATMYLIEHPQETIGGAYDGLQTASLGFLSGAMGDDPRDVRSTEERMQRHLHDAFVHKQWLNLQFGGLEVCTSATKLNDNGVPQPVTDGGVCRPTERYGQAYLRESPGSEDRKAVYTAIKDGLDPWDARDRPAVDMQQEAMASERLWWAFVALVGIAFVALLLVRISFAIIFAGIALIGYFAVSPLMIGPALIPAWHHIFHRWWRGMLGALAVKLLGSIAISLLLLFSVTIMGASSTIGPGWAFAIQTGLFIAVWIYRKAIFNAVVTHGASKSRKELKEATHYQQVAAAWRHPVDLTLGRNQRSQSQEAPMPGASGPPPTPKAASSPPPPPSGFADDVQRARTVPPKPVSHDTEPARKPGGVKPFADDLRAARNGNGP